MSTRRGTWGTPRAHSVGPFHGLVSHERPDAPVTLHAIDPAVSEPGMHASLSDIVARAQSIENRIIASRSRRKPEKMC